MTNFVRNKCVIMINNNLTTFDKLWNLTPIRPPINKLGVKFQMLSKVDQWKIKMMH